MNRSRKSRIYPLLAALFLLLGVIFNGLTLCGTLDLAFMRRIENVFGNPMQHLFITLGASAALIVLTLALYLYGLDPLAYRRAKFALWANLLPGSLYGGVLLIAYAQDTGEVTNLYWGLACAIALLAPLPVYIFEAVAGKSFTSIGLGLSEKDSTGGATFFLRNGLRWRPGRPEALRALGLMLYQQGKFAEARSLFERLGPIPEQLDMDVLRALERIYTQSNLRRAALATLDRQSALRPHKATDQKILDLCLELEEWQRVIDILTSGRFNMDPERLTLLIRATAALGRAEEARQCVLRVRELENAPFPLAVKLFTSLSSEFPDVPSILGDLGLTLLETQVPEQMHRGAGVLEKAIERDPGRLELRRRLARHYHETLQDTPALKHYSDLLDARDRDPETYLGYGDILRQSGRMQEAREVYRLMREMCPGDWRAPYNLADTSLAVGELDEAESLLAEFGEDLPESAKPMVNVLRHKLQQRRDELKLESIRGGFSATDDAMERRILLIQQLLALDRGEQAIIEADALLEESHEHFERVRAVLEGGVEGLVSAYRVRDYLAALGLRRGDFEYALDMFRKMAASALDPDKTLDLNVVRLVERAPDFVPARLELAGARARLGDWAGAAAALEPALDTAPEELRVTLQSQWIDSAYRSGRLEEALARAKVLLPEMESDIDFQIMMIHMLEDSGDYQGAFEVFKPAFERFPDNPELRRKRHIVVDNKKRDRIGLLERLNAGGELKAEGHYELAGLYREYEQTQKAIIHYQRASEDPDLHEVATTKLAISLCERRLFDIADETLNEVELTKEKAAKHPELMEMIYWVADILEDENYKAASLKYYKRLFRVDASFKDVIKRLEKLDGR